MALPVRNILQVRLVSLSQGHYSDLDPKTVAGGGRGVMPPVSLGDPSWGARAQAPTVWEDAGRQPGRPCPESLDVVLVGKLGGG